MKVDCYNACECPVKDIEVGDTFYYEGDLYIRIHHGGLIDQSRGDIVYGVMLSTGELCVFADDATVTKADSKVVACNAV